LFLSLEKLDCLFALAFDNIYSLYSVVSVRVPAVFPVITALHGGHCVA